MKLSRLKKTILLENIIVLVIIKLKYVPSPIVYIKQITVTSVYDKTL